LRPDTSPRKLDSSPEHLEINDDECTPTIRHAIIGRPHRSVVRKDGLLRCASIRQEVMLQASCRAPVEFSPDALDALAPTSGIALIQFQLRQLLLRQALHVARDSDEFLHRQPDLLLAARPALLGAGTLFVQFLPHEFE